MSVGRVAVKVNLKSLLDKTIVIENVEVEKPEITYELLSVTQNNISQLMENIKKNTAKSRSESGRGKRSKKKDAKAERQSRRGAKSGC